MKPEDELDAEIAKLFDDDTPKVNGKPRISDGATLA